MRGERILIPFEPLAEQESRRESRDGAGTEELAQLHRELQEVRESLQAAMEDLADPWFLSTLRVGADAFTALHPEHVRDADGVRVLRSVLMKPEHEQVTEWLASRVEALATR